MATPTAHQTLVSVIVIPAGAPETIACIQAVEGALADVSHELVVVYQTVADAVHAIEGMPGLAHRLRLLRSDDRTEAGALRSGFKAAAGDVVVPFLVGKDDFAVLTSIVDLANVIRRERAAIAIATAPRGKSAVRVIDWLLGAMAGVGAWNASTGFRAFSAEFLDRQEIESQTTSGAALELTVKAQFEHAPICAIRWRGRAARHPATVRPLLHWVYKALLAPVIVWGLWLAMLSAALVADWFTSPGSGPGQWINPALPATAVFALTLAVRRVRGRTRIADAYFSLVLLNPILFARSRHPFDQTFLAAGLLGLMAGAIIAMKQNNFLRYLAVALLALSLACVSETFILMLPAIVAWLIFGGFMLARSGLPRERTRGFVVMAAAEIALMVFLLACVLAEPTAAPPAATLFASIVGFSEFPALVLAIIVLALGWRKGPHGTTPPYFYGVLALLFGLLTMLLNNFQAGKLPPPGADQTVLVLCLLYTVFALHGPRRFQWVVPPILLLAAVAYTFMR